MSTTLRFRDHAEFHRASLAMAGAGAAAGLTAHLALGGPASRWGLGLVAGAAVVAAVAGPLRRLRGIAARAALVALGTALLVLAPGWGEPALGVAAFAATFGAALAWGARPRRLVLGVAGGAGAALLARYVVGQVATASELASLPGWAVSTAAGAAFSVVAVFALLPRHLQILGDPVGERYDALAPQLDGDVRALVDRGYTVWSKAAASTDHGDPNRATLEEGVLRLFDVAGRWRQVEPGGQETEEVLAERAAELDERIAATSDEVARAEYEQARAALDEQRRYLGDIATSRERVLARMHNYLALMERLRLAVVNLESTTASRAAVDIRPLVANLEEVGADIDAASRALFEA